MQYVSLGRSELGASRLGYGSMRIAGDGSAGNGAKGKRAILAAIDVGYTLFDHADVYAGGVSETLFGEVLQVSPLLRDQITIVGKCGIRPAGTTRRPARSRLHGYYGAHRESFRLSARRHPSISGPPLTPWKSTTRVRTRTDYSRRATVLPSPKSWPFL